MSTNAYRLPALQPYPIVRLLPFWGRCWCTGSRRQPLRRLQFMYTRTRARRSYITRYARIIGFSGSAGLSSPSGNGATNTRTGRPEPPCSTTFPRMIPVQHWSNRALKSYVLALMGAIRQYQSHTAGTCQNPTLRRLYSLPTLSRNETVENETNTANVASESERSEAIRKPRMRRNAQSRKY